MRLKVMPVAGAVPPVLFNAVIVGAELCWAFGPRTPIGYLGQAAGVGVGQLIACGVLVIPLLRVIEKTPALRRVFSDP